MFTYFLSVRRSPMLPHSCSCSVAPWGHRCVLASLTETERAMGTVDRALGTVVLSVWHGQCALCASPSHVPTLWSCQSGMDSLQYGPALVMYPDCGLSVWHGQSSVWASPSHVPRQWYCQSGTDSLLYGPALVTHSKLFSCLSNKDEGMDV